MTPVTLANGTIVIQYGVYFSGQDDNPTNWVQQCGNETNRYLWYECKHKFKCILTLRLRWVGSAYYFCSHTPISQIHLLKICIFFEYYQFFTFIIAPILLRTQAAIHNIHLLHHSKILNTDKLNCKNLTDIKFLVRYFHH